MDVPVTRVHEMVRERRVLAVRRGENAVRQVPALFFTDGKHGLEPVPTLAGTITLMTDAGFDDDEIVAWLLEDNAELGESPMEALRHGRRSPVRRAAQTLF